MTVIFTKIYAGIRSQIDHDNDNRQLTERRIWGLRPVGFAAAGLQTTTWLGVDPDIIPGTGRWFGAISRPANQPAARWTALRRDMAGEGGGEGRGGDPSPGSLRVAVGIATVGRPQVAREAIDRLCLQSRRADVIAVSIPSRADLEGDPGGDIRILVGTRGLTAQRNAILDAVPDADIVCFFDDDFIPHADYLQAIERAFLVDPALVGATGHVVADGITGAGYSAADADRLLQGPRGPLSCEIVPVYNAYGCNMAFRLDRIRAERIGFDERLPAYGWLEDVDFSRRVARFGRVAQIRGAVGVHLGVKGGRQSGRRFGYSQVANPIYLMRKGSYDWRRATWLMSRNLAMNILHAPFPEPHIDRRGRLAGNIEACLDLVRGRLNPGRIAALT